MGDLAPQARSAGASLLVVLEKDMGRAEQPVLMQGAQLDRAAELQRAGTAHQRNVMPVNHIEALIQNLGYFLLFEPRLACQIGKKRRKWAEAGMQRMYLHRGFDLDTGSLHRTLHQPKGIKVMDHLNVMAVPRQCVGKVRHKYPVTAEVVGWKKRCDKAEAHRLRGANLLA